MANEFRQLLVFKTQNKKTVYKKDSELQQINYKQFSLLGWGKENCHVQSGIVYWSCSFSIKPNASVFT